MARVECNSPTAIDLIRTLASRPFPTAGVKSLLCSMVGRLLVMFDSCHSGSPGYPKDALPPLKMEQDFAATLIGITRLSTISSAG